MISIFKKRKEAPLLEASLSFNLEPTFRCNLKCATCPRNSAEGEHLDMTEEVFSRICRELDFARSVDFTGWGEPLLHPRITSMIKTVSERGLPASMTTNGTLLSPEMVSGLIRSGLRKMAVSIDGMRPRTYEMIRKGALYSRVSEHIKSAVCQVKKESSPLELSLAFTIQKHNLEDLELIVPWMKEHGMTELHLKHLNVLSSPFDWNNSLLSQDRLNKPAQLRKTEADIEKIRDEMKREGMLFNFYSQLPLSGSLQARDNCLADPLNSVYISFDGKVSPCCHLGHRVTRYFEDSLYDAVDYAAGNIMEASLRHIRQTSGYQAFLGSFRNGSPPELCRTCYLLYGK